jgi:histidine ammonia-lyase
VGRLALRLDELVAVAEGRLALELDDAPEHRTRLDAAAEAVERALASAVPVYGVSTGVGASVGREVPPALQDALAENLLRLHGCGIGPILGEVEAASVVGARIASLARGWSGVRADRVERLCVLLNLRILPRIPEIGSVGASGDLTPLSYVASLLVGEREAYARGRVVPAAAALAEVGLSPLSLRPRESLALMNGTSFMTGLAVLAHARAGRLARLAATLTAATSDATLGNPQHFDARLFAQKPHPGSIRCAAWIRADLGRDRAPEAPLRLQDRYSIRCAPHVIGVLLDALAFAEDLLEIELNGVNDNPLIDPDSGEPVHGGNFYGGHVCFALDGLKIALASVGDLLDRQLVLLCDPATSGGLPENLTGTSGPAALAHHGMKAMQITASALAAEAQKLTMPASAFSRSTESHNQDKVSMGAIAAREALRMVDLVETLAAIGVLAVCQAVDLRGVERAAAGARALHTAVRRSVPALRADRRQDHDVAAVLALLRAGRLDVGSGDEASG